MDYSEEYVAAMIASDNQAKKLEKLKKAGLENTILYAELRVKYHKLVKHEVEILDKYIEANGL